MISVELLFLPVARRDGPIAGHRKDLFARRATGDRGVQVAGEGPFVVGGSRRRLADRDHLDDAAAAGAFHLFAQSRIAALQQRSRTRRSGRLSPLWARSNGRCSGDR